MKLQNTVLREDDPRASELRTRGWRVVARSWGAQLASRDADTARLQRLIDRVADTGVLRELVPGDGAAILALDAATSGDYPGGIATAHRPLKLGDDLLGPRRRGFGVLDPGGRLIAMTFVDVDADNVETDFTVVDPGWRARGLAAAVKAASVAALIADGAQNFRTGGSCDNAAIQAANAPLGYVIDESWLTLAPPAP